MRGGELFTVHLSALSIHCRHFVLSQGLQISVPSSYNPILHPHEDPSLVLLTQEVH